MRLRVLLLHGGADGDKVESVRAARIKRQWCGLVRGGSGCPPALVRAQARAVSDIVANAYPSLDPRLVIAAGGSVLAHLVDLERRGLVTRRGDAWTGV